MRVSHCRALVPVIVLCTPVRLAAQEWAAPVSRDSALQVLVTEVTERNPGLTGRRVALDAARHRIRPAGALPDPVLRVGWMDPFKRWHTVTQIPVSLEQEFPWPGTLGARTAFARAGREAAAADVGATRRELVTAVGAGYYRMQYLATALDALQRQRRLLEAAVQISTTRYATGAAPQSDPLQARLARDRLDAEEAVLTGERAAALAAINALRNRPPSESVAVTPLDPAGLRAAAAPLAPTESHVALALRSHPSVAARRATVVQAGQAVRIERLAARPAFALMVEYQYQGRVPITNQNLPDFGSVFLGLRLPIWAWRKQHRLADAARADSAAAAATLEDAEAQLARDVSETWARAEAARRRLELLVDGVLPGARATVESVVRSYQVGRTEFVTVIAVEDALFRAETETAAAAADYQLQLLILRELTAEETPQ